MESKLYVGNLSYNVTEEQLRELFSQAGTIKEISLIMDRDTQRPAHAHRRLTHDDLLSGTIMAGQNDDGAVPVADHLAAELFQPQPQECGKDAVLRLHDERVRLVHAAHPAEQGRRDHAPALLRRPEAQGMRLDGIEADHIVHAVPFNSPERLENRRARGPRLLDFVRPQELQPDLALGCCARRWFTPRPRRAKQCPGGRGPQKLSSPEFRCHANLLLPVRQDTTPIISYAS